MLAGVTDELKPPVAIRITRPYATEAEFLEREFDTLTHATVVLLGAQARPQGVVLRFEIVLKSGESLLRGEGRVTGYKERAYGGEPGLTLRFTRLDSRSKTLVDRASSLREARVRASTSLMAMPAVVVPRPGASTPPLPPAPMASAVAAIPDLDSAPRLPSPLPSRPSAMPPSSRRGPPPLPEWARTATPPPFQAPVAPSPSPLPAMDIESTQVDAHFERTPLDRMPGPIAAPPQPPPRTPPPPPPLPPAASRGIRPTPARPPPMPKPISVPPKAPSPQVTAVAAPASREPAIERPAGRDALLIRLRARAEALPPARIAEILMKRARNR
jgi:hypothetical protein